MLLNPTKIGLAVNEGKPKYMLSRCGDARRIDSQITADNYIFEIVKEFIYLLPSKVMPVWRSKVGSLLPTDAAMVLIGN